MALHHVLPAPVLRALPMPVPYAGGEPAIIMCGERPACPPFQVRLGSDDAGAGLIAQPLLAPPTWRTHPVDRAASLELLCGELRCHEMPHSARRFTDHLLRVSFLLEDWGCAVETCLAGLFHSVRARAMAASIEHSPTACGSCGTGSSRCTGDFLKKYGQPAPTIRPIPRDHIQWTPPEAECCCTPEAECCRAHDQMPAV